MEQRIKQEGGEIGRNIRRIRKEKKIGQKELAVMLQIIGIPMTRDALVKIERGTQHISLSQLQGIRDCLGTTYDELLRIE